MNKKTMVATFRNVSFAVLYIFLVSQVMANGERLFGKTDNTLTPFGILLLFTLSAAVVGGLVFGESVMLFFEGKRKESVMAAVYSVGWLGVYTIIALFILAIIK